MAVDDRLLAIGRIAGTHGVRGQLRVTPYSGDPASITALRSFLVKEDDGSLRTCTVQRAVPHGNRVLVTLAEGGSIEQVAGLVGREVWIQRSELPELEDDEYYWCDLIGLRVVGVDGAELGTLQQIFETGSNDVYVVRGSQGELLLPATSDVVLAVDLTAGCMTVAVPEGLV